LFEKSGQPHTEQPSVFIRYLPVPQGPKDPKIHQKNPQPNNRNQESYTQSERLDTVQEFKMTLEELELQIDMSLTKDWEYDYYSDMSFTSKLIENHFQKSFKNKYTTS